MNLGPKHHTICGGAWCGSGACAGAAHAWWCVVRLCAVLCLLCCVHPCVCVRALLCCVVVCEDMCLTLSKPSMFSHSSSFVTIE